MSREQNRVARASSVTRRIFLRDGGAAAAVVAAGAGTVTVRGAGGANERTGIGVIGCGDRGSALMRQIQAQADRGNVEITAVCDVWKVNLDRAVATVNNAFGAAPYRCTRFGDLLERREVDAVVIATPDFGHTPILIASLKAGKDAYVEKPMALEISAANEALDLARAKNRIVQAGTQYRSNGGYAAAAIELANGVLGRVNRISATANFNQARWRGAYDNCKQADVDWDAYLFNRPGRPFDPKLLRRWQLYRTCTNGLSGLWMSHYVDAVHRLTGARYPASAVAHGGTYVWQDGREHGDTFHALLEYPEGFLFDWGMSLGNSAGSAFTVYGTEGTLEISRGYVEPNRLMLSPAGGAKGTKLKARKIEPEPSPSHMGNWLDCLRSRKRPNADIQFGHQHAVATIMAAAALHTGRRQTYDADQRVARTA